MFQKNTGDIQCSDLSDEFILSLCFCLQCIDLTLKFRLSYLRHFLQPTKLILQQSDNTTLCNQKSKQNF